MSEILLTCPTCRTPNFTQRGLSAHKCKGPLAAKALALRSAKEGAESSTSEVEVVTASQVADAELSGIASEITSKIDLIHGHEDAFDEATLEHRLEIGLHVAKAQELFTLSHSEAGALKGKDSESLSTVDRLSEAPALPTGFVSWLAKSVPRLKRPTAYRYASAFRALALPLTATPKDITAKVKTLRHEAGKAGKPMPKISDLLKLARKPEKNALIITAPKDSKQLRLEDAREALQTWKDSWDKFVKSGQLDDLHKKDIEALKEFQLGIGDQIKARLK